MGAISKLITNLNMIQNEVRLLGLVTELAFGVSQLMRWVSELILWVSALIFRMYETMF